MKRTDLHVGDELYWATPSDWKANRTGKKVTVLHVEPYGRAEFGRREIRPESDGRGNGVHVKVQQPSFGDYEDVVRLGEPVDDHIGLQGTCHADSFDTVRNIADDDHRGCGVEKSAHADSEHRVVFCQQYPNLRHRISPHSSTPAAPRVRFGSRHRVLNR